MKAKADAINPQILILGNWYYPYPPLYRYILNFLYLPFTIAADLG